MVTECNSFQEVQRRYNIVDVAEYLRIRLHRVSGGYRANSIFGDGSNGKDAFAIYEESNSWYDFMQQQGGDITDLVAIMKYDGDKYRALCELIPEHQHVFRGDIDKRKDFMKFSNDLHERLMNPNDRVGALAKAYLNSRGITDDTIRELKIGLDFSFGSCIRIRFPYWDMSAKNIIYYISRKFPHGQSEKSYEEEAKYVKASKNSQLKNSLLGLNTLKWESDYCVITEGVFDWLNLYQLRIPCLAPNGTEFSKEMWPEVIEHVKNFKYVILAFDNDSAGIDATLKAAKKLIYSEVPFKVAQLLNAGDVAEYFELKRGDFRDVLNHAQDGLKWYLNAIKPNKEFDLLTIAEREKFMKQCRKFVKLISCRFPNSEIQEILLQLKKYLPKELYQALSAEAKKGLSEFEACERVLEKRRIMYNERIGFYVYTSRHVWERQDDTTIQSYISNAYGSYATGGKITSTLKLLKAHELVNSEIPLNGMDKKCALSFFNGTLHIDIKTRTLDFRPHSPEDYITVRIPYFYIPDADCPVWRRFIAEVVNHRLSFQAILQEFAGYVMLPDCKYQVALLLKGGGSNGKGVYTETLAKIFGYCKENTTSYVSFAQPSKFGKDFRLMEFKTSWLNISTETENDFNGGEGVFKTITAGEVLNDSYKHRDPISFRTRTKLIMCANSFPEVRDTSTGFMRRLLIVPFDNHYVSKAQVKQGTNDKVLDPDLKDKIDREMSGIINWMIAGALRLLEQNSFTEENEIQRLRYEFAKANNHLYGFIEDNYEELKKTPFIHRNKIYQLYVKHCAGTNSPLLAANKFYSKFRAVLESFGIKVEEKGRFWTINFGDTHIIDKDPELPPEQQQQPPKEEPKPKEGEDKPLAECFRECGDIIAEEYYRLSGDQYHAGDDLDDYFADIVRKCFERWSKKQ